MTTQSITTKSTRKLRLPKFNSIKWNLFLDIGLALAFVVEMERHFTGLRNHEVIGIVMGAAFILHIVLHWNWVWSITKRFFHNLFHSSRLNYVLNVALLVDMAIIIVTGVLISETLGLNLGIARDSQMAYKSLHILASNVSLLLVGTHVAIHWKWILTNTKKYILRIGTGKSSKSTAAPAVTLKPSTVQE